MRGKSGLSCFFKNLFKQELLMNMLNVNMKSLKC